MLDIELVKHCQNGKLDYFGELYDRYINKIYKFIYIKTGDKELSEDLTSEVFLKSLNKIDKFKQKKGATFQSWIYKIAYNQVIDYYRSKKNDSSLKDYMNLGFLEDFGKKVDDKNKLKEVLVYLGELKKEHKEIIIMRIWEDLSFKEISEINGLGVDNCKQIFCRTIKKIDANLLVMILILFYL